MLRLSRGLVGQLGRVEHGRVLPFRILVRIRLRELFAIVLTSVLYSKVVVLLVD